MLVLTLVLMMAALAAWAAWFSVRKVRRIGAARYFGAVGRLGIAVTVVTFQFMALVFGRFLSALLETPRGSAGYSESHDEYYERTVLSACDEFAVPPADSAEHPANRRSRNVG
ncbi:hypothetical protein [Ectothiorhodospira variabilis]|uniref:hypothetical protein n=1 Tax=Ectothiorhodospira variabilis TaxID=505694 RepID=UPI001EFAADEA|nr:hypothetical protein [Ectothiorhodospira variabilis]MCG5495573.1 hypothetical protein [Ectothiorhodospira variabilis]MCG5505181.1 hypothetical protein [Ectothiorhodospira variabilis]MCG5508338.1 hypothetical protein [Ectothiorhodospira variabilis]